MTAGMNIRIAVWRATTGQDDVVGGAQITGTYIGEGLARMKAEPVEQLILQQGLETDRTFSLVVSPASLDIREGDRIEIVQPTYHPYYNQRFRVRSSVFGSYDRNDPRSQRLITVSRSVRAHANQ